MASTEIGDKEKIQILLAEYASLRSETNARISSAYTVTGIGGAMIAWLLQQPVGPKWWIGLMIAAAGGAYCARVIAYDAVNAARRVRELEAEINRRAGEKLLVWEHDRGGLNSHYWRSVFLLPPRKSHSANPAEVAQQGAPADGPASASLRQNRG